METVPFKGNETISREYIVRIKLFFLQCFEGNKNFFCIRSDLKLYKIGTSNI